MTAMDTLKNALEASLKPTPTVMLVGLAVVLLFPVLLHFILSASTPYNTLPSVLLVGPSGAGKTALLTLYERGLLPKTEKPAPAQTHTSQTPASVELAVNEDGTSSFRDDLDASGSTAKKFLLVDTPGHAKLRRFALSRLRNIPTTTSTGKTSKAKKDSKLKAVVFVVDAAALADSDGRGDSLAATAEYLYEVLLALQKRMGSSQTSRMPSSVPVLVAANKLDLFSALPAALVKSQLETEIGRIRKTRSRGLLDSGVGADDLAATEESDNWLGEYGSEKFTFAQMLEFYTEVDVIGGNVAGDGPGADKWWKWIAERI
ncbi:signal recognition particle receptor beta subunit-domain-containing protein [Diplogelasinospora grovesii]|uniref:Signal recognition particle receptor subunit beta n=1 Tax=Diplogelasinospora grovesii TaxID=303347 RepID=A0AAN6N533_9PEZI|nr:signal recognition particle receptor beta subunit-domain-containing protein [Diplogelasinospora grovesii]